MFLKYPEIEIWQVHIASNSQASSDIWDTMSHINWKVQNYCNFKFIIIDQFDF